jgi:hypothetical protein
LYIGLTYLISTTDCLPQTVLSLRGNGPVGQGDPELAVLALLLDLVWYADSRLLLL